jgi:hypothetical protein
MLLQALTETALNIAEACIAISLFCLLGSFVLDLLHQRAAHKAAQRNAAYFVRLADIRVDLEAAENKPYAVVDKSRRGPTPRPAGHERVGIRGPGRVV